MDDGGHLIDTEAVGVPHIKKRSHGYHDRYTIAECGNYGGDGEECAEARTSHLLCSQAVELDGAWLCSHADLNLFGMPNGGRARS